MNAATYTTSEVCRALHRDNHPESGWVRRALTGEIVEPREIWLAGACMWVRAGGRYVSGWRGTAYLARQFGRLGAWRIRRAVRRWAGRRG